MGVLDDAIREHLELKRKHGAAEDELKRQEAEALGPVRREVPEPAAEATPVEVADAAESDVEVEEAPVGQLAEPESFTERLEDEPFSEVLEPHEPEEEAPVAAEPPAPEPPLAEPEPGLTEPEPELEEPAEPEPAPSGDEEDVLEETPDFLQETPEHDRLWFEQKPPRDFDFD